MKTNLEIPKPVCDSVNRYLQSHQTLNPSRMSTDDVINAVNTLRYHTFKSREAWAMYRPAKFSPRTDRKVYRLMGKLLLVLNECGCNVVTQKDSTGHFHTYALHTYAL